MSYNTPAFLLFLAVCLLVYYALPGGLRCRFLLLASCAYYLLAAPQYFALVAATAAVVYAAARGCARARTPRRRNALFAVGLLVPLAALFFFKYLDFFARSLALLLGRWGIAWAPSSLGLVLPLGISFYTFQAIGYLIDVRNGVVQPERDFWTFALFVSFFPQILAGPIGRARELLPQYRETHAFSYGGFVAGAQRFLTGAFKKIVIADGLGVFVDEVYASLPAREGMTVLLATLFYAVQLYFDFAGYTDMALGTAKLFGFTLRENFAAPYFATNFSGFWKRWHMSLTSWFTDYVFTPLVWSRWANKLFFGKKWDEHRPHFALNLLLVFLVSGLWHGAAWTFVIWGLLNGLYRVGEELLHKIRPLKKSAGQGVVKKACKRVGVFLLFAASLVFFRAAGVSQAMSVFAHIAGAWSPRAALHFLFHLEAQGISATGTFYLFFWGFLAVSLSLGWLFDLRAARSLDRKGAAPLRNPLETFGKPVRWLLYWFMGFSTMLFWFLTRTLEAGGGTFLYAGF